MISEESAVAQIRANRRKAKEHEDQAARHMTKALEYRVKIEKLEKDLEKRR